MADPSARRIAPPAGAEVFVGDLLNVADVATALRGCRRVYFSMSLSPTMSMPLLMAAPAKAHGDVEVFVNISESEQTNPNVRPQPWCRNRCALHLESKPDRVAETQ
jgi:hypothetical protein